VLRIVLYALVGPTTASAANNHEPYNRLPQSNFLSTGIPGLDNILSGGLLKDRIYLIEGEPGTGKTTTGLQFLVEGAKRGESVVYITLAETAAELEGVARIPWLEPGRHPDP
jgi:circadian clock protein KaiC